MKGYSVISLYFPINPINIGSVLRAMSCFNSSLLIIEKGSKKIKSSTDVTNYWKEIPVIRTENIFSAVPYACVPVAIEITDNAKSLVTFHHPKRAMYIFGPENGSLPNRITSRCKYTIKIPTSHCLNLAAAANIVLYDRYFKEVNN